MRRIALLTIALICCSTIAFAQKQTQSPTQTAITFYRALKERRYIEGFHHSVYRSAIEGLTAAEMQELEPEFARTFTAIPAQVEGKGEQISGDTATVTLKFAGIDEPQQVGLIRVSGEWLVGDAEMLAAVKQQGRAYFFNARMSVNEGEAAEMMLRMIGAELIYARKFEGRNAALPELIRLGGVPKDLEGGEASGYRFTLTVSADQKTFFATAVPVGYGKTGKLSFYADIRGVRAEDLKGRAATANSPSYQPK